MTNPTPSGSNPSPDTHSTKRKVQPLLDITESQLLTPSQLNLPTLSVLETDLASKLDNYRPKEIIHKDTPARELVGNALPPKRSQEESWDVVRGLLEVYPDLPVRDVRTVEASDQAWILDAVTSQSQQPVRLFIPRRIANKPPSTPWSAMKIRLQNMESKSLPGIVHLGLLMGGYPLIATENIQGPSLFDCHAGIHLPHLPIDWNAGHGRALLCLIAQTVDAVNHLHNASAWMGRLNWHSIQISREDGRAKLLDWQIVSWLFEPQTEESLAVHQQKDREDLGRLIYLMVYCHQWHRDNWRFQFEQPLAAIASAIQSSPSVPQPIGEIVAKCIKAPKSQHYTQTSQLVDDLKTFLDRSQLPQESSSSLAKSTRTNKAPWRRIFTR